MSFKAIRAVFTERICKCDWSSGDDWRVARTETSNKMFFVFTCRTCGTAATVPASFTMRYEPDEPESPKNDGMISRRMTKREGQILDAIRSEMKGIIKHEFHDGFYWVDLCTSYSEEEARLLDHCGKDKRGSLWSLRDKHKVPHLTVTITDGMEIVDIKGRHNKPPKNKDKYIKYMGWLFDEGYTPEEKEEEKEAAE